MNSFAAFTFDAIGVFCWLTAGAVAGWLADAMMKSRVYGLIGDVIVGVLGGVACGSLFGLMDAGPSGFIGSILVAFFGGCILVVVVRLAGTVRGRA